MVPKRYVASEKKDGIKITMKLGWGERKTEGKQAFFEMCVSLSTLQGVPLCWVIHNVITLILIFIFIIFILLGELFLGSWAYYEYFSENNIVIFNLQFLG